MPDFWKSAWNDFLDFWKTQVFWAALVSCLVAFLQWRAGHLRETKWEIIGPYVTIVGLFLIANIGRTIYRTEQKAFRKSEHSDKRRVMAEIKAENAPVVPPPNIQFRKIYRKDIRIGYDFGSSYPACLVEIGNEVLEGTTVGRARSLRAQLVYKDSKTKNILHTECPAMWNSDSREYVDIPVGEGRSFILAIFDRQYMMWRMSFHDGMEMRGSFDIQARILQTDGSGVGEAMNFKFQWDGNYSDPSFRRI